MTIILLTGAPGVGKTMIVMRVANELKARGMKVGGVVSREVRINNVRTGFEFIDLATNDRDVLAYVTENDPRVGKYFVNLSGCRFAADRVKDARSLLKTDKKAIVVIHKKLEDPLIDEFRERSSSLINVNLGYREKVNETLLNRLIV
jgi:nucleoside-triphosphatase